ncbi:MAG TPA: response regulator transcription factor [Solirubrobacteraceae bacterium]|nr:response regulator transcription factor [Solirubrobacteraceae bacterium]
MAAATVLVADDDPDVLALVGRLVEGAGHRVVSAGDGQEALQAVFERRPDLVVLDIGMPKLHGWQVLERIREVSDVPVLMLTGHSDELDKVRGLREGADDFVTKPFGTQELAARIDALLRRSARSRDAARPRDVSRVGPLEIDHRQRQASVGGAALTLTPLEFRLLAAFARNPGEVLSGERIIELVWHGEFTAPEQVKLLVGRLRRKLAGADGAPPIETVRGFGYRLAAPGR